MQHKIWFLVAGALAAVTGCSSGSDSGSAATGYLTLDNGEPCTPDMDSYKPKGNNGHGNNIDGIDISNPGNGPKNQPGVDPSEPIDDEKKGKHGDHDDGDNMPNGCDANGCCDDDIFDDGGAPNDDDDDDSDESYDDDGDNDGEGDDDCPDGHEEDPGNDYEQPPQPPEPDSDPVL